MYKPGSIPPPQQRINTRPGNSALYQVANSPQAVPPQQQGQVICDAIKQNESELEKDKTQFSFAMYASISELYYAENPIKIEHTVPKI